MYCLLDYEAKDSEQPLLVVVSGFDKPIGTTLSSREYATVRALGAEYLARNPRSIA